MSEGAEEEECVVLRERLDLGTSARRSMGPLYFFHTASVARLAVQSDPACGFGQEERSACFALTLCTAACALTLVHLLLCTSTYARNRSPEDKDGARNS